MIDVTQAACALSNLAYKYFYNKKYQLNVCNDQVKKALAAYLISIGDCDLKGEDINCFTENLGSYCNGNGYTVNCVDDISISFSKTQSSCIFSSRLANSVDGSAFAKAFITDGNVFHSGKIDIVAENKCGYYSTEEMTTGCSISGCTARKNIYGFTQMQLLNVVGSNPNGYIKNFTFYHTDSAGMRPLVQKVVDISPSNLSTWNTCPTCTNTYNATHLVFGSPFYALALGELLNNVVKTTLGGEYSIFEVGKDSSDVLIHSLINNKPIGYWAGINPDQGSLSWINQAGSTINVLYSPRSATLRAYPNTPLASMYEVKSFTTTCGNFTTTASYSPYWDVNEATSNLDKLELSSLDAKNTGTSTYSPFNCVSYVLKASVTTNGIISTMEWRDPLNVVIGETDTVTVSAAGTYTFSVTTLNGCTEVQTINV